MSYNHKEDTKKLKFYTEHSIKCDCGHTTFLGNRDYVVCSHCGHYVFKDNKTKIEYGTRVGFYSTGKCRQAPVNNIILVEKGE